MLSSKVFTIQYSYHLFCSCSFFYGINLHFALSRVFPSLGFLASAKSSISSSNEDDLNLYRFILPLSST